MSYIKKVAIVGAGGRVGRHIVNEILKQGKHDVTAITRHDSMSSIPDGVKTVCVNYDDPSTLVAALQGQQALVITMNARAPPDAQEKLIAAAAEANVPYIIPNGWGRDVDGARGLGAFDYGERIIASLKQIEGLGKSSWILVACGFWYEFSLGGRQDQYGFDVRKRLVTFYDDGKTLINTSTWPQVGRGVAKMLALKETPENDSDKSLTLSDLKNKHLYLSSALINQKDMFDSLLRVTGTKPEQWEIDYEGSRERYEKAQQAIQDNPANMTAYQRLLYATGFFPSEEKDAHGRNLGMPAGCYEPRKGLHNDALGLDKEDLDDMTRGAVAISEEMAQMYAAAEKRALKV